MPVKFASYRRGDSFGIQRGVSHHGVSRAATALAPDCLTVNLAYAGDADGVLPVQVGHPLLGELAVGTEPSRNGLAHLDDRERAHPRAINDEYAFALARFDHLLAAVSVVVASLEHQNDC
jgi:hypothetical protein